MNVNYLKLINGQNKFNLQNLKQLTLPQKIMVRITTHKDFTTLSIKIKLSIHEFRALASGESMKVICCDEESETYAWIKLQSDGHVKHFELDCGSRILKTEGSIISMW
jgi:hypothetical protein